MRTHLPGRYQVQKHFNNVSKGVLENQWLLEGGVHYTKSNSFRLPKPLLCCPVAHFIYHSLDLS